MRIAVLVTAFALLAPASAQAAYRDFRSPSAKVLRYGTSTTFRRLKCVSRRLGMTCRSLASGRGFRVSVEKQETF